MAFGAAAQAPVEAPGAVEDEAPETAEDDTDDQEDDDAPPTEG